MKPVELTSENFLQITNSEIPVLVDFWATWCGPCRLLSPIVDEIAEDANGFIVAKVNVDECPDIANQFSINAIPTLLVFKNGKVVNKSLGLVSKEEILNLLK